MSRPEGLYELLTFLPGDVAVTGWDFDWDDDVFLDSAAELLADLNLVLREYNPPAHAVWYQPKPMAKASTVKAFLETDSSQAQKILANLDLVYKYLKVSPPLRTPRHVIHNDFAWYNVVRHEHSAVGVIDFDSAQVNTELHDLAYAVYAFAPINHSVKEQPRSLERTAEGVAQFVTRYEQRMRESLGLNAEVILDAAAYRVALSGASLIRGMIEGEERAVRLLSHAVGYAEWLRWYDSARSDLVEALRAELIAQNR